VTRIPNVNLVVQSGLLEAYDETQDVDTRGNFVDYVLALQQTYGYSHMRVGWRRGMVALPYSLHRRRYFSTLTKLVI